MSEVVSIRLPTGEAARLREAAERDGISLSEHVRRAARHMAIPVVPHVIASCPHFSAAGHYASVACGQCGPIYTAPEVPACRT